MSRVQLALNVTDLEEAVGFYSKLFGAEPAKRRPGYANFAISEPPLKLVLIEGEGKGATLNHLGVLPSICTSRTEDARDVRATVAALKEDRVAAIPTIARNAASPTDLPTLNKLRAACPARKEENPVDLQVAHPAKRIDELQ